MTKKEAIMVILNDTKAYKTSLNYAVGYCKVAMTMVTDDVAFNIQVLYILNNITRWRHPQAKEVREVLRGNNDGGIS